MCVCVFNEHGISKKKLESVASHFQVFFRKVFIASSHYTLSSRSHTCGDNKTAFAICGRRVKVNYAKAWRQSIFVAKQRFQSTSNFEHICATKELVVQLERALQPQLQNARKGEEQIFRFALIVCILHNLHLAQANSTNKNRWQTAMHPIGRKCNFATIPISAKEKAGRNGQKQHSNQKRVYEKVFLALRTFFRCYFAFNLSIDFHEDLNLLGMLSPRCSLQRYRKA